jgi:hypothetical protein
MNCSPNYAPIGACRDSVLLLRPEIAHQGSTVTLRFHTQRGPILGTIEMLMLLTSAQQPFRFIALSEQDQRTLPAFQSGLYRNSDREQRIEEFKAVEEHAPANWHLSRRRHPVARLAMGMLVLALCVAAWGSSAFAAPQKSDLSVDFSHAALKYLMVVATYDSTSDDSSSTTQARINSAYNEMARVVNGDKTGPETLTALLLKIFGVTHMMNVKTYQLTGDRKDVGKDETCISDWKQSLQSRSSNQPETCR